MIDYTHTGISQFITHFVGNKSREEGVQLSEETNETDEASTEYLLTYFLSAFKNVEPYAFNHNIGLEYNEIYSLCCKIFDAPGTFLENSKHFASHLHEHSLHPKIKAGELSIVLFRNLSIDGETMNGIGIFKTETKDVFLKVSNDKHRFVFRHDQGININKLEKGCLVLDTEREEGFKVLAVDKTGNEEAQYWKNEYMNLKSFQSDFSQTKAIVEVTKSFITKEIDKQFEVDKTGKIEMMEKSLDYFKNTKQYDEKEYVEAVFDDSPELYKAFQDHRKDYSESYNVEIDESFDVSERAVKKATNMLKSIIKLDKNFHIYVHGGSENIERGFDKQSGKNYYIIYFDKES